MEEQDLYLIHDDKFGEIIKHTLVDEFNLDKPVMVSIIRFRDRDYLSISRMYVKGNELRWGKGVRLAMEEEEAETVCLAMQGFLVEDNLELG